VCGEGATPPVQSPPVLQPPALPPSSGPNAPPVPVTR